MVERVMLEMHVQPVGLGEDRLVAVAYIER
jgi:hypothetical protein